MNIDEIKLWAVNISAITISFTQLENTLKMLLLVVSIGYSIDKWVKLRKNKNDDNK